MFGGFVPFSLFAWESGGLVDKGPFGAGGDGGGRGSEQGLEREGGR